MAQEACRALCHFGCDEIRAENGKNRMVACHLESVLVVVSEGVQNSFGRKEAMEGKINSSFLTRPNMGNKQTVLWGSALAFARWRLPCALIAFTSVELQECHSSACADATLAC